jgi:hypothetical protein
LSDSNDEAALGQALRQWVIGATGLADAAVIFQDQDAPAPNPANIAGGKAVTVHLGNLDELGSEWRTDTVDTVAQSVTAQAVGTHRLTAVLKAFTKKTLGNDSARALLKTVMLAGGLDSVLQALNEAGLGLLNNSQILVANKVQGAKWESQAVIEVYFCVLQTATETIPYIAHVNGTGTVHAPSGDPAEDVVVPIKVDLPP